MRRRIVGLAAALALVAAAEGRAQGRPERAARGETEEPQAEASGRPRPGLERLARAIERGLQLDGAQARRLRDVSARYAGRRQALAAQERTARRTLRQELTRGDAADEARVGEALTSLLDAQRRRVALVGSEQQELAEFLTPVQRARFLALQERALRAAHRARMRREAGGPSGFGAPPAAAPPRDRRFR